MSTRQAESENTRGDKATTASEKPHLAYIETNEQRRLNETRERGVPWKKWGPYLSERQWGTVREDYSHDGNAWDYFSHDHARSRAYRWGEDGLAGISDDRQQLCEWTRPNSERTVVRPDQQRGQPRRGCQRILLLSRQYAYAFLHEVPVQISTAGIPLLRLDRNKPPPFARGTRV